MEENIKKFDLSDRVFMLSGLLVLVFLVSIVGGLMYSFQSLPQNIPQEIYVSGTGKSYVKPDIAKVSLGVKTESLKSQDAIDKNNKIMNDVLKSIKELGVEEKDIQTTMYNLTPVYDWTDWGGRTFKGYSLNQQVLVKIRNFDKINEILDKATAGGVNNVGDLQFTADDIEKVKAEARKNAIANAKEKAIVMAEEAGLKLGKLVNIYETNYNDYNPVPYGMGSDKLLESSVAPSIQVGESEIVVNVNLSYKLK